MKYNIEDFSELVREPRGVQSGKKVVTIGRNVLRMSSKIGKQFRQYSYLNILFNQKDQLLLLQFNTERTDNSYKITWLGNSLTVSSYLLLKRDILDSNKTYKFKPVVITENSVLIDISEPYDIKKTEE